MNASHLDTDSSYTIRLTTDNNNMGFDSRCTDLQEDITVGGGSAHYVNSRTLHACTAPGGTVTATLMEGTTPVHTITQQVTVPGASAPSIAITDLLTSMEEGESDSFTMSTSDLETTNSYTIRVTTDNGNLGYNWDCTSRQHDESVTAGRNSYTSYFILYGCAAPGGTVTPPWWRETPRCIPSRSR